MSSVISEFKLANEGLGNKHPVPGFTRKKFCPLCPNEVPISGPHVIFFCDSLKALRSDNGIAAFLNSCMSEGMSWERAYHSYINGFNSLSKPSAIPLHEHYSRAKCVHQMRSLWLSKWD